MIRIKIEFLKHFSIVVFLYLCFIFIVWFAPEYEMKENYLVRKYDIEAKISWTLFLGVLLHFTYITLEVINRIMLCLEEKKKLREMENETNL